MIEGFSIIMVTDQLRKNFGIRIWNSGRIKNGLKKIWQKKMMYVSCNSTTTNR